MAKVKNKKEKTPLSASRIKTLDSCSWEYWAHYILKIPDKTNSGAIMGSCCHNIYEFLGEERRLKYFTKLVEKQSIHDCPVIKRYILSFLKSEGLDPEAKTISAHGEQISHIDLVNRMLIEGLNYDFFGGEPDESYSEIDFDLDIEKENVSYRMRGFIDKLFLYKNGLIAKIRDFKSSKKRFEGKELDDNIQDIFYRLAVRHLKPEFTKRLMEFVFLQFDCSYEKKEGIIQTLEDSDDELDGFEHFLTDIQYIVDNFDEEYAKTNFAADKGWPKKEEGFAGLIKCGRGEFPGHMTKDQSKELWRCPMKLAREYWVTLDRKKNIIESADTKKELKKRGKKEKRIYGGCPKFQHLQYNQEFS